MPISSSTTVFLISVLGVPLTYIVNSIQTLHGSVGLLVAGVAALSLVLGLTYFTVGRRVVSEDKIIYVFILGCFSSVVDLIIGLENDGLIHGFMTHYLKEGEPYLKSAYGTMICYWDGIGHYAMYIMMLSAHAWGQSFHDVGLYWAGSFGHSLIVFLPGNVVGKYSIQWSLLLNAPFILLPFYAGAKFLREKRKEITHHSTEVSHILRRPVDLLLIALSAGVIAFCFFRGFVVLGCQHEVAVNYLKEYEPYLTDLSTYGKIQVLVYMYYFIPVYMYTIYSLIVPGQSHMPALSLVLAGASMQAQVSYIGSSIHKRTPFLLRVPSDFHVQLVFWLCNLTLLVLPQLIALRCNLYDTLFYYRPWRPSHTQKPHRD